MFFGKDRALKAHLKHNIPANLWYVTSHNGVSMFAYARYVEEEINDIRNNLVPGSVLRPIELRLSVRQVMYFTDRSELKKDGRRTIPGVAGSIAEFNRLCDLFPSMAGPNLLVDCKPKSDWTEFGYLDNADQFVNIVHNAKAVISDSINQFGK